MPGSVISSWEGVVWEASVLEPVSKKSSVSWKTPGGSHKQVEFVRVGTHTSRNLKDLKDFTGWTSSACGLSFSIWRISKLQKKYVIKNNELS